MKTPECHLQYLSKDKSDYTDQYVFQLLANKISSLFPEHSQVYTDGSVKGSNAGVGVCIPYVSLNISETPPSNTSILSTELFAIQKAMEVLVNLRPAIQLMEKYNYKAADSDLKSIRDSLQILKDVDTSV